MYLKFKSIHFENVKLRSPLEDHRRFGEQYYLHLQIRRGSHVRKQFPPLFLVGFLLG